MSTFDDIWGEKQGARSAFPCEVTKSGGPGGASYTEMHAGMDMRQYYAAHAPAVPDWFRLEREGSMPAVRPTPDSFSDDERAQLVLLYNGTLRKDAASVEVVDFWMAQSQEKFALDAWRNKMREKKFFAWRWHYADMMIQSEGGQ